MALDHFCVLFTYIKFAVFQGSPLGRSASPIDLAGSPHSPSTLGGNGPNQPVNYPDAMALAGQNYQHFMDLTNEVQKIICYLRWNCKTLLLKFCNLYVMFPSFSSLDKQK